MRSLYSPSSGTDMSERMNEMVYTWEYYGVFGGQAANLHVDERCTVQRNKRNYHGILFI